MKAMQLLRNPWLGLICNLAYGACCCVLGLIAHSWWFIAVGAYYAVLACARFSVLMARRAADGDPGMEAFARRVTGVLLVILSCCLAGVNFLSALEDRGTRFHEIIMISIALYAFAKAALAITGKIRSRSGASFFDKTLRSIALADAAVSIYSLQRSMLVSFPGMQAAQIRRMNIITGTAAWCIVLLLGIHLIGGKHTIMAKSKLIQANEKIAEAVTGGYKKMEQGVVKGYKKIEDKFVDAYLTHEGETVAQAKARLKGEDSKGQ